MHTWSHIQRSFQKWYYQMSSQKPFHFDYLIMGMLLAQILHEWITHLQFHFSIDYLRTYRFSHFALRIHLGRVDEKSMGLTQFFISGWGIKRGQNLQKLPKTFLYYMIQTLWYYPKMKTEFRELFTWLSRLILIPDPGEGVLPI